MAGTDGRSGALATVTAPVPASVRAVLVAVLLAVAAYGGGNVLALVVLLALEAVGVELTTRYRLLLSTVTIQLVFFTGVSLAYLRYRGLTLADVGVEWPELEDWMVLGAGFVGILLAWLAAALAAFVVAARFGIEREQQRIFEIGREDPVVFLLLAVLSLVVVGPTEELLFRGVIQSRLRETFGVVAGLGVATALFASIHLPGFVGSLAGGVLGVTVLFVVGLVLAVTYEYTDNLVVPAVVHGLFNATQAAFAYLGVRFGDPEAASVPLGALFPLL